MIKAKEIVSNKFWVIERDGINLGVLKSDSGAYEFSSKTEHKHLTHDELTSIFGANLFTTDAFITKPIVWEVHGYRTSHEPFNAMYDVRNKLPMFTKTDKSKIYYCAGTYIIKFNTRWAKKFCPKLETLRKYEYHGPYHENELTEAFDHA